MSNKVEIEITETRSYQITVDLDEYDESVKKAYKEKNAQFFSDWSDDAECITTEYDWS